MTQTFLVIDNEALGLQQTWYKSGALTGGFWEDPIINLYDNYPVRDYHRMIERLKNEKWEVQDLHPAQLFYRSEKLVWLRYENDKLAICKPIYC